MAKVAWAQAVSGKWIAKSLADMQFQGRAAWEAPKGPITTMARPDLPQLEVVDELISTPVEPPDYLMAEIGYEDGGLDVRTCGQDDLPLVSVQQTCEAQAPSSVEAANTRANVVLPAFVDEVQVKSKKPHVYAATPEQTWLRESGVFSNVLNVACASAVGTLLQAPAECEELVEQTVQSAPALGNVTFSPASANVPYRINSKRTMQLCGFQVRSKSVSSFDPVFDAAAQSSKDCEIGTVNRETLSHMDVSTCSQDTVAALKATHTSTCIHCNFPEAPINACGCDVCNNNSSSNGNNNSSSSSNSCSPPPADPVSACFEVSVGKLEKACKYRGHVVVALGAELFMCVRCCLSSSFERGVGIRKNCGGSDVRKPRVHESHSIFAIGQFLVCFKCGTFAGERVRLLSKACTEATDSKERSQLKSWSKGVHPVSGVHLGCPKRWRR